MIRNIALSLLALLTAAAGPVDGCNRQYQRGYDAVAANLAQAELDAARGYRPHQPDLTGLDVTHERYSLWRRDPHGRPFPEMHSRWHYVDESGQTVTLLDLVDIDQPAAFARQQQLRKELDEMRRGKDAWIAQCLDVGGGQG